jgi:hypothetical protein
MGLALSEHEIGMRASRLIKLRLRQVGITYEELALRLPRHGLPNETVNSIKAKLKRGTFPATFLIATLAALGLEGFKLGDI